MVPDSRTVYVARELYSKFGHLGVDYYTSQSASLSLSTNYCNAAARGRARWTGVPILRLYLYHLPVREFPLSFHMTKTTQLLTRPASGTIVKPAYEYDEEQKEKLLALREVSLCCILI